MKRVQARYGTTIILVSHHVDLVKEVAHRAILFENGEIVADGDPGGVCDIFVDRCGAEYLKED